MGAPEEKACPKPGAVKSSYFQNHLGIERAASTPSARSHKGTDTICTNHRNAGTPPEC